MAKQLQLEIGNKIWTKEAVKELLQTNEKARIRALLLLYGLQTDHEKCCGHTAALNGVGFNKVDSVMLTSFAKQYKDRGFLSDKQLAVLERRIPKYSKQIFTHMRATH